MDTNICIYTYSHTHTHTSIQSGKFIKIFSWVPVGGLIEKATICDGTSFQKTVDDNSDDDDDGGGDADDERSSLPATCGTHPNNKSNRYVVMFTCQKVSNTERLKNNTAKS